MNSRVLLVNMPFSSLRWPNIGPSLLKAALARRGIACDIAYLNFDFAEQVGLEGYNWLADHFGFVLGGERLFAKHFFPGALPDDESYYRDILLRSDEQFTGDDDRQYEAFGRFVPPFVEHCQTAVDWSRYDLVGFASSFQQTMPSMCIARWLKSQRPELPIVFGGAACEAEMGEELLRCFPEIDYVFLGEADVSFPDLVEQLFAGGPVQVPAGVASRVSGDLCVRLAECPRSASAPSINLDELPYPDFDDYFARLQRSPLRGQVDPLLFFETSRGCWWGEKHHCAFCGLNGGRMAYRSKTASRVMDELRYLTGRHQVFRGCTADNILDHRYFQTLLPMLQEARLGLEFIFEMKCNLTRPQVDLLCASGLSGAQLGIETFSTPLLKRIDKGATGVQNLQTLKWLTEMGVEMKWNFLYGFPGEDPAEYAGLADLLPSLYHLAAPLGHGRVRMDRFSPYFENPAAHGAANPRPNAAFRYVYPFPPESLARMAYYYEYDYADGRNLADYVGPLLARIQTWLELDETVMLRQLDRSDGVLILTDTRPGAAMFQRRLTGVDREIYLYCDTGRPLKKIAEHLAETSHAAVPSHSALQRLLDGWVQERIMAHLDDRYLSLALRARPD